MLHHDTYTGSRWRYASRYRPFGHGTCPPGFIVGSDSGQTKDWRFGTRDWPHRLNDKQAAHLDMVLVEMILTPIDALREIIRGAPSERPADQEHDNLEDAESHGASVKHWELAQIARNALIASGKTILETGHAKQE